MIEKLTSAGLTMTESKIYITLVDLGKAQAGVISRQTGIHRRSVYDALERLIEKGLVSWIKENEKRFYVAEDPNKLLDIIDVQKKDVQEIMPQLNVLFNEKKEKQETKFYRGVEGIKTIFEDQIREGVDTFIIGASYNAEEILKFYMPHYTSKRIKKKIKLHLIYCGEKRAFSVPFGETRYLSKIYASPVSTNVYADKVAIIVWSDEPVAILIKNKSISNTYKNYFNLLWDVAEKKREKPAKTPESFEV